LLAILLLGDGPILLAGLLMDAGHAPGPPFDGDVFFPGSLSMHLRSISIEC